MAACTICHVEKDLGSFPLRVKSSAGKKKGEPTAICRECTDQRKESRKKRAGKRKAKTDEAVEDGLGKDDDDEVDLGEIAVAEFLDAVKESDSPVKVRAQVDIITIGAAGATPRECTNKLATALGDVQLLYWTFENQGVRIQKETKVFSYSCAQSESREHKPKVQKGGKGRDSDQMDRFPCDGWLHLMVSDKSDIIGVVLKHSEEHVGYLDVHLPEKWKQYIQEHARAQTPGQASSA
ncbi:hypothetical protein BC628DRAFT_1420036 [Trametes gibbosa]|nr:hypothetical protein BC628DRAFT_1420036 [Trametes gibbosa]